MNHATSFKYILKFTDHNQINILCKDYSNYGIGISFAE